MNFKKSKTDLMLFAFWLIYFMPLALTRSFGKIEYLGILLRFPIILVAVSSIHKKLKNGLKNDHFLVLLAILLLWNGFCVFIHGPRKIIDYSIDAYQIVEMTGVIYYSYFKKGENCYRPLYYVSLVYIYANALSMILFPNGIFISNAGSITERSQWLFGSKNNMPIYMTLFSFTIMMNGNRTTFKKVLNTITIIVACCSTISAGEMGLAFMEGSSTGIVTSGISLVAIYYLIIPEKKKKRKFAPLTVKRVLVIMGILNIILLGGVSIPIINSFIINVLGKNLTYTNRIYIWANVMNYIRKSPIIGHGIESVIFYRNGATSTYNIFLGLLKAYGIPSVLILLTMLLNIPDSKKQNYQLLLMGLFAVFINGLMSQVDIKFVLYFAVGLFVISFNSYSENFR